jgi:tRNA-binding protein
LIEALNKEEVSISDFTKLNIVLGTILDARPNVKAKKPAYILKIDFGNQVGIKSTSAQVTNYSINELIGRQVIAVCNLPSKKVAGFTSEVLVLGAISGKDVHLLRTDINLQNGTLIG